MKSVSYPANVQILLDAKANPMIANNVSLSFASCDLR